MDEPTGITSGGKSQAEAVAALITSGKPRKARRLARSISEQLNRGPLGADFWYQYALADLLAGKNPTVHINIARSKQDYTEAMDADFLRDQILSDIRTGKHHRALSLLSDLHERSAIDENRRLAAIMVEGRIKYQSGQYADALELFVEAAQGWRELGYAANKQWEQNNLFHLYKSWAMTDFNRKLLSDRKLDKPTLEHALLGDPNRQRQLTVHVVDDFGHRGLRLLDVAQTGIFRLQRLLP